MSTQKILTICTFIFFVGSAYGNSATRQASNWNSNYDIPPHNTYNYAGEIEATPKSSVTKYKIPPKKTRTVPDCRLGFCPQNTAHNVFYLGAFGGYGLINGANNQDGQYTQGRLAIGAASSWDRFLVGAELGVQSGNTMHLSVSDDIVVPSGGLEWLATLKPLADLLLSTKVQIAAGQPFYITFKAGAAYRQLQLNDRTSPSYYLQKVSPEAQIGLSFNVSPNAMLTLLYQGIYSTSNVGPSINDEGNATISHIPTQQAGFIGIEYSV